MKGRIYCTDLASKIYLSPKHSPIPSDSLAAVRLLKMAVLCLVLVLKCNAYCPFNHLAEEERAGRFTLNVFFTPKRRQSKTIILWTSLDQK